MKEKERRKGKGRRNKTEVDGGEQERSIKLQK